MKMWMRRDDMKLRMREVEGRDGEVAGSAVRKRVQERAEDPYAWQNERASRVLMTK